MQMPLLQQPHRCQCIRHRKCRACSSMRGQTGWSPTRTLMFRIARPVLAHLPSWRGEVVVPTRPSRQPIRGAAAMSPHTCFSKVFSCCRSRPVATVASTPGLIREPSETNISHQHCLLRRTHGMATASRMPPSNFLSREHRHKGSKHAARITTTRTGCLICRPLGLVAMSKTVHAERRQWALLHCLHHR